MNFGNLEFSPSILFLLLAIWEGFWKAVALWKSAKKSDLWWFIGILIVNSFGILPIFYLWRSKQLKTVLEDIKSKINKK